VPQRRLVYQALLERLALLLEAVLEAQRLAFAGDLLLPYQERGPLPRRALAPLPLWC
jgi:hypothetical protein